MKFSLLITRQSASEIEKDAQTWSIICHSSFREHMLQANSYVRQHRQNYYEKVSR